MSESMRDLIRDELAGWVIGSGYYTTAISVGDARDMADAVLAVLADHDAKVRAQALREARAAKREEQRRERVQKNQIRRVV